MKPTLTPETRSLLARKLASALTQYDARQQAKGGMHYNRYALPLYLQAVHTWEDNSLTLTDPVAALAQVFTTAKDDDKTFSIPVVRKFVKDNNLL